MGLVAVAGAERGPLGRARWVEVRCRPSKGVSEDGIPISPQFPRYLQKEVSMFSQGVYSFDHDARKLFDIHSILRVEVARS